MPLLYPVPIVVAGRPPVIVATATSAMQMAENIPVPAPRTYWQPTTPSAYPTFAPPNRFVPRQLPHSGSWLYPIATSGTITSEFGWRIHPISGDRQFHAGLDIAAPLGTPVLAPTAARVRSATTQGGYGLTIVLEHYDGPIQTLYGHLSRTLVQAGQRVQPGQVIGAVGSSGQSTGPHLHFEVRRQQQQEWAAIDPTPFLQTAIAQRHQTPR
jgi:murein DD-endopeptidase MepM/ murein hydrolase activator NlpD